MKTKRYAKKLLSLALCALLIFSALPLTASAAELTADDLIIYCDYVGNNICWIKGNSTTVTAPNGYQFKLPDGTYGSEVTVNRGTSMCVILKDTATGDETSIYLDAKIQFDTEPPKPKGKSSAIFFSLIGRFGFAHFFVGNVGFEVNVVDPSNDPDKTGSGIRSTEYFIASDDFSYRDFFNVITAEKLEAAVKDKGGWQTLGSDSRIDLPKSLGKYVVYLKATDKVGNVSYFTTYGIVLYEDSTLHESSLSYTHKSGVDLAATLSLRGNTVNEITINGVSLTEGEQYTVTPEENSSYSVLTIKQDYLDTLDAGKTYEGSITFNPGGIEYVYSEKNNAPSACSFTLEVYPKFIYDFSAVQWNYTSPIPYDGLEHSVSIDETTLPEGVSVTGYSDMTAVDTGTYTTTAYLEYDKNYQGAKSTLKLDWTIENNWTPAKGVEYTVTEPNENGWLNREYEVQAKDGYLLGLTNKADGEWQPTLRYTEGENRSVEFYVKNQADGTISLKTAEPYSIDTTAPVIAGVKDGETYFAEKSVSVTDKNLQKVTVNGKAEDADFSLPGNKDAEYVITAVDKAGNETSITVKTVSLKTLTAPTAGLTEENVHYDDEEAVLEVIETLEDRLSTEDLSEAEEKALTDAVAEAEALLEQIDALLNAVQTDAVQDALEINTENVTTADKETVTEAIENLEDALETFSGNYSEDDKEDILELLTELKAAAVVIEHAEAVESAVKALPETLSPDDEETVQKLEAAAAAYDALTDYEKSLTEKATAEKLEALLKASVAYDIVKGDSETVDIGKPFSFTANGLLRKFTKLLIDGKELSKEHYDVKSGSTVITLKADYLKTLAVGEHKMTVVYTDGEASGTFKLKAAESAPTPAPENTEKPESTAKPTVPTTGDSLHLGLWLTLTALGAAALLTLCVFRKRTAK